MTTPFSHVHDSATIGTSEYFLFSDSTTAVAQTTAAEVDFWIDFSAMTSAEVYDVQPYEKVNGGSRIAAGPPSRLTGVQSSLFRGSLGRVKEGYEVGVTKVSGTDRAIAWGHNSDVGDRNVTGWNGSAPDNLSSGKVPVDVKLWLTAAPAALSTNGYLQTLIKRWLTDDAAGTPPTPAVNGVPIADTKYFNGTVLPAPTTAGIPKVEDATARAALTDIQSRIPAALAGGFMKSDMLAVSGDSAAADALEAHLDNDTDPWDAAGGGSSAVSNAYLCGGLPNNPGYRRLRAFAEFESGISNSTFVFEVKAPQATNGTEVYFVAFPHGAYNLKASPSPSGALLNLWEFNVDYSDPADIENIEGKMNTGGGGADRSDVGPGMIRITHPDSAFERFIPYSKDRVMNTAAAGDSAFVVESIQWEVPYNTWEELAADHTNADTFGDYLDAKISAISVDLAPALDAIAALPTATEVRDAILSYSYASGRTVVGYIRRAGASLEKADGLLGSLTRFLTQAGAVIWSIAQDPNNGTRGAINLGNTEDPP